MLLLKCFSSLWHILVVDLDDLVHRLDPGPIRRRIVNGTYDENLALPLPDIHSHSGIFPGEFQIFLSKLLGIHKSRIGVVHGGNTTILF